MSGSERAPELLGHRGARGLAPENTLEGFDVAVALGVDALELDVGMSADGEVVIHHDTGLNPDTTRAPDGSWVDLATPVRDLTLAELKRYDVGAIRPGSAYARRFPFQQPAPGARVPTLAELFEWSTRRGLARLRFTIEVKVAPHKRHETPDPALMAGEVLRVITGHGMRTRVVIQSFDWRVQRETQALDASIVTAYLSSQRPHFDTIGAGGPQPSAWTAGLKVSDFAGSVPRLVRSAGGAIWSPDHEDLTRESIAEARRLGLRVVVWTVNEPSHIERVLDLGVDGIITDYPDRVREAMAVRGLPLPGAA